MSVQFHGDHWTIKKLWSVRPLSFYDIGFKTLVSVIDMYVDIYIYEKKKKNIISMTCYISSAYILKYMIQLVIEGKNQKTNMPVYDIPL